MQKQPAAPARGATLTRAEFQALSERLLLVGLREQELAEQCRRAEVAARESTERWQLALAAGRLGSWELDLTTFNLESSATCHGNFGLPPQADLSFGRLLELILPDDRSGMQAAVEQAIAQHTDYVVDYRVTHPDGSVHWIAAHGRPYYADDGTPRRMVGTTQDITERKQQADALSQRYAEEHRVRTHIEQLSAEREAMLAHMAEGIILANADGRVTFLNAAARALLGLADLAVSGENDGGTTRPFPPGGDPYVAERAALARAAQEGEVVPLPRRRLQRANGTEIVIDGSAAPIFAADTTRLGAVLALRDVTADADLERRKEDFLTAVAHDLGSPLTIIRGYSQMLSRRAERAHLADSASWLAALAHIDSATAQMSTMLEALLDLGRLQLDAQQGLQRVPTDLVPLARRLLADHQQRTTTHALRLETAAATLVGWWDADRLERAIANLLSNAIKYSPNGGDVTVRLWQETDGQGPWALLSIRDQGIGIPSADLPNLFERFRRGSNVVGWISGTGIGLMSVQQIAIEHGGTIAVDSSEGAGSTFTLKLPVAAPADAAPSRRGRGGGSPAPTR